MELWSGVWCGIMSGVCATAAAPQSAGGRYVRPGQVQGCPWQCWHCSTGGPHAVVGDALEYLTFGHGSSNNNLAPINLNNNFMQHTNGP